MLGDDELRALADELRALTKIKDPAERVRVLGPLCSTEHGSVRSRLYRVRAMAALVSQQSGTADTGRRPSAAQLAVEFEVSKQTAYTLVRDGVMMAGSPE